MGTPDVASDIEEFVVSKKIPTLDYKYPEEFSSAYEEFYLNEVLS